MNMAERISRDFQYVTEGKQQVLKHVIFLLTIWMCLLLSLSFASAVPKSHSIYPESNQSKAGITIPMDVLSRSLCVYYSSQWEQYFKLE